MIFLKTFIVLILVGVVFGYAKYQPEQIHLSLGENGRDMVVTWSTMDSTRDSFVEYGIGLFNLKANGTWKKFVDIGLKLHTQEIHRVVLVDLKPNITYQYRCGGQYGWSSIFQFKTLPQGNDWPLRLAIYGDLGNENAKSLPFLQKETQDGEYHAILHIGDFAYDFHDNNGVKGDEFMRQIESIAAYVPYMVTPGNHEAAYNFSHYRHRFTMPGDNEGLFYSINIGPVHLISFSSEFYYFAEFYFNYKAIKMQYEWLKEDLEKATKPENRQNQPWIIVMAHRPFYCSSNNNDDCTHKKARTRVGVGKPLKYGLESLFYQYGVDIGLWAHEHIYERFYPIYNYTVYNSSDALQPYVNPQAPVHITAGSAGCWEQTEDLNNTMPNYVAFRTDDYGYTKLKVFNASHVYMEQVSVDLPTEQVIDSYWIIKDDHKPYEKK